MLTEDTPQSRSSRRRGLWIAVDRGAGDDQSAIAILTQGADGDRVNDALHSAAIDRTPYRIADVIPLRYRKRDRLVDAARYVWCSVMIAFTRLEIWLDEGWRGAPRARAGATGDLSAGAAMSEARDLAEHDAVLLELVRSQRLIEGGFAALVLHQAAAAGVDPSEEEVKKLRDAFFAGAHHLLTSIRRAGGLGLPMVLFVASVDPELAAHAKTIEEELEEQKAAFDAKYRGPSGSTH